MASVTSTKLSYVKPCTGIGDLLWQIFYSGIHPGH